MNKQMLNKNKKSIITMTMAAREPMLESHPMLVASHPVLEASQPMLVASHPML